jgi:3-deoxy-7-phosphoheptulonate synthase
VHATLPLTARHRETVRRGRQSVASILHGTDDRLLVIVGPCSIHDPAAGLDYAQRLADAAVAHAGELSIVMRTYFEKPRTTVGWKGLISDPGMDGTFEVNEGIMTARRLLLDILSLDQPVGGEFVDPVTAPFLADAMSWGAIGARTSQSPVHRQLASGLPMPIGFKNATNGDVNVAIDGALAAADAQMVLGTGDDGVVAAMYTTGNPAGHVVLRGGAHGSNFDGTTVARTAARLEGTGLPQRVIVDASHGNSGKDHRRQRDVVDEIAGGLPEGAPGVAGVMLESFLVPGRQDVTADGRSALTFGQSVTDACMGWEDTVTTLEVLAGAVVRRRAARRARTGLSFSPASASA